MPCGEREDSFMTDGQNRPSGLTTEEAERLQARCGKNELRPQKKGGALKKLLRMVCEPMFLLLLAAAAIYFALGEPRDGAVMLVFVAGIVGIDVIQEWKTDRTLSALRDLSAPKARVVRDGREQWIPSADLVPGDLMLVSEGDKIAADGAIVQCSDLCVDESMLTGESEGVWKSVRTGGGGYWRRDYCYAGTLVTQGSAAVRVERIGAQTEYGKIGLGTAAAPTQVSPLKRQTGTLVRTCAAVAGILFALVCVATWFNIAGASPADRFTQSVLAGITLAMAMIPEEFPVILTVFLSMGAWRLARERALVRSLPGVETLGAVSVLCVDKTGTVTQNRMQVQRTWAVDGGERELCEMMGLACEPDAYDPMERAMLDYCAEMGFARETLFCGELAAEYAFTSRQKMMGHVWRRGDGLILAAKGSPESILPLCGLKDDALAAARDEARHMAAQGLRVIAVGAARLDCGAEIPTRLDECRLRLCGLTGLADPPREGVREDIAELQRAGIRVIMITGDNGVTAAAIADKVGIRSVGAPVTGDALDAMSDEQLRDAVGATSVFSRVAPEHKMRIVKALQENGEIVAMTGDGVNDAPALKCANIGVAMGGRGSEVAREAADLILLDDQFSTIVRTVRDGRRIYDNIRRAVGYVFAIHIPIALSALLAPMLGISSASIFLLPLHVVLLELMIDPTCSIVLERLPAEADIMERPPRSPSERLLTARTLGKSAAQGLAIFAAAFGGYYTAIAQSGAAAARSVGLTVLILANLLLVLVNCSAVDSAWQSMRRLARDGVFWAAAGGALLLLFACMYTPLNGFFKLAALPLPWLLCAAAAAAAATLWYELVKYLKRRK